MRLREIEHGSLAANHEAKMKWIEEVRKRDLIAEKTDKANEQHYEVVMRLLPICWSVFDTTERPGSDGFHHVLSGAVREVFVVSVSYWAGKPCEGGGVDARELLREGAVERRYGCLGFRVWYVPYTTLLFDLLTAY